MSLLWSKLAAYFPVGSFTLVLPGGHQRHFGDGTGPKVVIQLRDMRTMLGIAANPELRFGEAYMDGALTFLDGDLLDFFALYERNAMLRDEVKPGLFARLKTHFRRRWQQRNGRTASRRNVAHHYDLSGELYRYFLDAEMHYSCAYFEHSDMTLDEAQQAKARHIAAKLDLKPGQSVLEIGSGWGGLARAIARAESVTVRGLTLSTEQLAEARQRVEGQGLSARVTFALQDYREEQGRYDRIVSVGMFEHVGAPNFETFFRSVNDRLTENGVALIHSIGRKGPPGTTNPWIEKYIFPGGYIPALSETLAAVEKTGLWVTDVEILRVHYAETCRLWRARFQRNENLVRQIYGDRFFRMWDFYLAVSEAGFRSGDLVVFQLQLSKSLGALPITRGYMAAVEQELAAA